MLSLVAAISAANGAGLLAALLLAAYLVYAVAKAERF